MAYIVMHRSAHMPNKVKARYRRVAVVEVADGLAGEPTMISKQARGIRRIVQTLGTLSRRQPSERQYGI